MRNWIVIASMLVVAAICFAAAPSPHNYAKAKASFEVTGAWTVADSFVAVSTDTSNMIITISGTALLEPHQTLFIGFNNDSANMTSASNATPNNLLDTFFITSGMAAGADGYVRVPFTHSYVHTVSTQTDITDTFYLNMRVSGYQYRELKNNAARVEDLLLVGSLDEDNKN